MQIEKGFADNWLQPTGAQEKLMRQYAGCQRFVWNRALAMEQARYRRGEKEQLGKYEMMKQLTMWRNNPDPHSNFLKDAPMHALQCSLYELYDSDQRFFRGQQVHPPQFKKKSKARISFTESDPACFEMDEPNQRVRLPKLGWVKCRFTQHIEGQPSSVTVKWNGRRWVLSVECQVASADQTHPSDTIVAGDFGVVRGPGHRCFLGRKAQEFLPAWAQEQGQVQPELEEGGSQDFETRQSHRPYQKG